MSEKWLWGNMEINANLRDRFVKWATKKGGDWRGETMPAEKALTAAVEFALERLLQREIFHDSYQLYVDNADRLDANEEWGEVLQGKPFEDFVDIVLYNFFLDTHCIEKKEEVEPDEEKQSADATEQPREQLSSRGGTRAGRGFTNHGKVVDENGMEHNSLLAFAKHQNLKFYGRKDAFGCLEGYWGGNTAGLHVPIDVAKAKAYPYYWTHKYGEDGRIYLTKHDRV